MGHTVHINLGERSYDIRIEAGSLADCGSLIKTVTPAKRCLLVTNDVVKQWYLEPALGSLKSAGFDASPFVLPDGEHVKSLNCLESIYHAMIEARIDRHGCVIALGGGVVGDLAGFAAATYMRGIDFVQIPTTLLAQVDSSVGGKTGINLREGKNLVGAFYQPRLVVIDPDVLSTLDGRQLRAGFAEVIKYGIIYDADLFAYLEDHIERIFKLDSTCIAHIVAVSCSIKADVVEQDERESGLRAILNFGHTVGHAIEAVTGYDRFVHGEAVAVGMAVAVTLANSVSGFTDGCVKRVISLLKRSQLPYRIPSDISTESIIECMRKDKKVKNDIIRFVLPERIGKVKIVDDVPVSAIARAIDFYRSDCD